MGNEESGMFEEDGEVGQLPGAKGGRRGAAAAAGSGSSGTTSSNYGDYGAASGSRRRGGRRGNASGSSGNDNSAGSGPSADKYQSPSADKYQSPSVNTSSSSAKAKGGDDDIFSDLNLPLGETPKSISDKGRKAFNQAIWSPRGKPKRQDPKVTENNNKDPQMKSIGEKNTAKSSPDKKKEPTFNFDSLYFNQTSGEKKPTPKSEMDDDLFSNPFGVSNGPVQKETKSRSINVDVKLGNAKLKQKVRSDRQRKQQQKQKTTFHRPNSDMMYDAFDDLEEEMIGEGVIGNGNKKGGNAPQRTPSMAKPKQLQWNTGQSSSHGEVMEFGSPRSSGSGHRSSNRRGSDDGWF